MENLNICCIKISMNLIRKNVVCNKVRREINDNFLEVLRFYSDFVIEELLSRDFLFPCIENGSPCVTVLREDDSLGSFLASQSTSKKILPSLLSMLAR